MKTYSLLNYAPRHEDIWGVEIQLRAFLTSALDGDELSAARTGRLLPGKELPVPIG